uniref:Zinc finger protein Pegasus n=1 Tax=Cacopsylla melanoneura TaxID=428564 RepID=A0A8D8ZQZ5_9HEMI
MFFKTTSLDDILFHSKACEYMPRLNGVDHKFVCYMCNYGTYKMELIRAHVCSHSGEKPFKCRFCSYRGTRRNHLLEHERNKHKPDKITVRSKKYPKVKELGSGKKTITIGCPSPSNRDGFVEEELYDEHESILKSILSQLSVP